MGGGVAYCIYHMQVTKAEFTRVREELEAAEQGEASPAAAKKKKKPKKKVRERQHGSRSAPARESLTAAECTAERAMCMRRTRMQPHRTHRHRARTAHALP